jgi:DNA mismatch repair protein MutL
LLNLPAAGADLAERRLSRLERIFGDEFTRSAVAVAGERGGAGSSGFAGLTTLNRRLASTQFLFVNGRPVRDRLLHGAIRAAYQGLLPSDRHAVAALFLDVPASEVDVNVHPMKTEVRFRDAGMVRGLIVSALRHALGEAGHRTAVTSGFTPAFAIHPTSISNFNRSELIESVNRSNKYLPPIHSNSRDSPLTHSIDAAP